MLSLTKNLHIIQDLVFTDVKSFHGLSPRRGGEIAEMEILPHVFLKRAKKNGINFVAKKLYALLSFTQPVILLALP